MLLSFESLWKGLGKVGESREGVMEEAGPLGVEEGLRPKAQEGERR